MIVRKVLNENYKKMRDRETKTKRNEKEEEKTIDACLFEARIIKRNLS